MRFKLIILILKAMLAGYLLDYTSVTYLTIEFISWIVIFVAGLGGLFVSLYILISHDDVKHRLLQPMELANIFNSVSGSFINSYFQFVPLELLAASIIQGAAILIAPWYFNVITFSLFMFDYISYRAKKHRIYFITLEEYKPFGKGVSMQYIIKSITYAVLFAVGLIMLIITGVSFFK